MKTLLLFTVCILLVYSAKSQYTASFTPNGKLEKITNTSSKIIYPTVLYKKDITLELNKINVPGTKFYGTLNRLNTISIPTITSKETFENTQAKIQQSVKTAISGQLSYLVGSLITGSDTAILEYDNTNSLLPIKKGNKTTATKVISRFYTGATNFTNGASTTLTLDGSKHIKVEYDIIRNETDNHILEKHLELTKGDYKGIPASYEGLLRTIRKAYWRYGRIINSELVRDTLISKNFNIEVVRALDLLKNESKYVPSLYKKVIDDNDKWIKHWLWYTGGKIQLNPFNATGDTTLIVSRLDEQILEIEEEIKSWQSYIVFNSTDLDKFESIKKEIASLSAYLQELKAIRVNAAKLGTKYKSWINQRTKESKILYSGTWHLSSEGAIKWMQHFDADKNFNPIQEQQKLPDMVAEMDEMILYVHNVKAADKIKLTSSSEKFQPKSPFEETVEEIANQFATVAQGTGLSKLAGGLIPRAIISSAPQAVASPLEVSATKAVEVEDSKEKEVKNKKNEIKSCISNIKSAISSGRFSFANKSEIDNQLTLCHDETIKTFLKQLKAADTTQFVILLYENLGIEDIIDYRFLVQDFVDSKAKLDWLLSQTKPPLELKLRADETPVFRTVVELPEQKLDITSSSKVTYSIFHNDEKDAEVKKTYKKYTQSRFLPNISLAYVGFCKNRTVAIFDNATGQFMTDKRFDNVEVFVGAKYYPGFWPKTNPVRHLATRQLIKDNINRAANTKRGNSFENTLFITGGVGVRHQFLRNYNLGLGLDLFPGVSIHGGCNFIFQKYYTLQNGKVINEQERPKGYGYISISFDPGIIAGLTRLFIN